MSDAIEAAIQAEHQPPCSCGQLIGSVEVDTSRGITGFGKPMQVPKTVECEAGHVEVFWIDWPVGAHGATPR